MGRRSQNFSVSQEYSEVWEILDKVDNKSQFICEAIIHYAHNNNLPEREDLKNMVAEILDEMLSDDIILVKGSKNVTPQQITHISQEEESLNTDHNNKDNIHDNSEDDIKEDDDSISAIIDDLANDDDAKDIIGGMLGLF